MLYDPKWNKEAETKADPFSLESLIAWLETMPPDQEYCYQDNGHCLLGKYFRAKGFRFVLVSGWHVDLDGKNFKLGGPLGNISVKKPWTFGAALKRARAVLATSLREGEP